MSTSTAALELLGLPRTRRHWPGDELARQAIDYMRGWGERLLAATESGAR